MNNDVRVCFDDMDNSVKKIEVLLDDLRQEIDNTINDVIGDTDSWQTKYQRIFDKHISEETKLYIYKIIDNCKKYNDYINKSMQGYRKIDILR